MLSLGELETVKKDLAEDKSVLAEGGAYVFFIHIVGLNSQLWVQTLHPIGFIINYSRDLSNS